MCCVHSAFRAPYFSSVAFWLRVTHLAVLSPHHDIQTLPLFFLIVGEVGPVLYRRCQSGIQILAVAPLFFARLLFRRMHFVTLLTASVLLPDFLQRDGRPAGACRHAPIVFYPLQAFPNRKRLTQRTPNPVLGFGVPKPLPRRLPAPGRGAPSPTINRWSNALDVFL